MIYDTSKQHKQSTMATGEIVCARREKSIAALVEEYHLFEEHYGTIVANAMRIVEDGFNRSIDVRGDGNCLIYAIIVYLFYTRNSNVFVTTLMPFCDENDHIVDQLVTSPGVLLKDSISMRHIADQIRNNIYLKWDYKGNSDFHMNERAIDGLARVMVMRLLGVEELVCYTLCPDKGDPLKRKDLVTPEKVDLRPDIEHKWQVTLLSPHGYTHYHALLR